MSRFIVFDVETPNYQNNRMSAIGITVIEDGEIVDDYYSLVNPETHFDYFNIQLTGISEETVKDSPTFPQVWQEISEETVKDSPTFPQVWQEIEPYMSSGMIVAHNAVFDLSVLKKCLRDYDIQWKPYVRYVCTGQTGRRLLPGISHKLNDMCDYYGIALDHHKASSDSRACAEILLRYLAAGADIRQHIRTYSFTK